MYGSGRFGGYRRMNFSSLKIFHPKIPQKKKLQSVLAPPFGGPETDQMFASLATRPDGNACNRCARRRRWADDPLGNPYAVWIGISGPENAWMTLEEMCSFVFIYFLRIRARVWICVYCIYTYIYTSNTRVFLTTTLSSRNRGHGDVVVRKTNNI